MGSNRNAFIVEAFSVTDFCAAHSLSRGKFYGLLKLGLGPRIMKVGRRTLVSREAAADWRHDMERHTATQGGV